MSLSHRPKTPPPARTTLLTSSSGTPSTPTAASKLRVATESNNPPYQRRHRRTPAVSVPSSAIAERSSFRITPPPPLPRIPSSYAPRLGDLSEERDIPRPLPQGSFGRERVLRNQATSKGESVISSTVERGKSPMAGGAMRRSESSNFPSRPRPENTNPLQGQLRGLTPSRLPRSSSTNWRLDESSILRPRTGGRKEKSPQRLTIAKLTPFVTNIPRIEKQPHQRSYLTPLPVEGTPISPERGPARQQSKFAVTLALADDTTGTPSPQHECTNTVHAPGLSTEYHFHEAAMLRSPPPAITRHPGGPKESAPRRLVTTYLTPFVEMAPSRALPPGHSGLRPAVSTGFRHTSDSSLMITQRQLLQPLGPPIPRSRTMSALTPALAANPRQIREAQPPSYWSGRFTALNDRFCNENMTLTSSKRVSDDRRIRRIFILLESLCVTKEAKESLKSFQSVYLANQKHIHLSFHKDEEKDRQMSVIKRIIGHVRRRSGGAVTDENLD